MTNHAATESPRPAEERTRGEQYYRPQVDILETPEELLLVADVPGAEAERIDVQFEDGELTLHAPIAPRQDGNTEYLLREYGVGGFYRTFRVAESIDAEGIRAEYADGVLRLHLPKAAASRPRKIQVRGS